MKKLLWLLFLYCATFVYADDQTFVYNEHGKHDPFWPLVTPAGSMINYESDMTATDMVLEGVVVDAQGNNLAIINGKVVKMGDTIGSYLVEDITNDHVNVSKGEERLTLRLKKGNV